MSPLRKFLPYLGTALGGLLLALCFAPWGFGNLAWIWPFPFFVALWLAPDPVPFEETGRKRGRWRSSRAWSGFKLGYVGGLVFFLATVNWLFHLGEVVGNTFAGIGAVACLSGYLAIYWGLAGAFASTVGRPTRRLLAPSAGTPEKQGGDRLSRALPAASTKGKAFARMFSTSAHSLRLAFLNAAAWVGLEWLRGWLITGFGWNGAGAALYDNLVISQSADLVGVTGLAFLPVFTAIILAHTVARIFWEAGEAKLRPHLDFALAMLLLIGAFFYGLERSKPLPGEHLELRALLVQPGIPQAEKWDINFAEANYVHTAELTSLYSATASDFDTVIWPESALFFGFHSPDHPDYLKAVMGDGQYHLILGSNLYEPAYASPPEVASNALAIVPPGAVMEESQFYRKIHLVPFGEFLPLRPALGWMLGGLVPGDFDHGTSTEPLALPLRSGGEVGIVPTICFEDTVGRLTRKFVRPDTPAVIVNVTNDGWFGDSAAAEQHLANARFRCIELRRPMLRSANTGVTCAIDHSGRIVAQLGDPETGDIGSAGCLPASLNIAAHPPTTLYARLGDLPSIALGLIAFAAAIVFRIRRPSAP